MLLIISTILLVLWLAGLAIFNWGALSYVFLAAAFCTGIMYFISGKRMTVD